VHLKFNRLHNQNIIILGSRSYVGRYLSIFLEEKGFNVIRSSSETCDLTDPMSIQNFFKSLTEESYTVIFLAMIIRPHGNSFEGFEKNIQMTQNFVENVDRKKISSMIYFSSVDVYGINPSLPISENTCVSPDNWYGLAKFNCEWILKNFVGGNIPLAVLRIPGVYGASQGDNSVVCQFMNQIRNQKKVTIFGNGSVRRAYLLLDDLAQVVEQLLPCKFDGLLNLVPGTSQSLLEILECIGNHLQIPFEIVHNEELNQQRNFNLSFDISQLNKVIPVFEFTELEKGIQSY